MAPSARPGRGHLTWAAVTVLLVIGIGGTLCVPIYARATPRLGDFPFFYWYQLIWVPVVGALSWPCSLLLRARRAPQSPRGDDPEVRA